MKLLLLDNYDSFTFNLVQIIEEWGKADLQVVSNDQISLDQVKTFDKILLSPGPDLPAQAGLMPEIIQHFSAEKSILGVCLGHQAIAQSFGASLINLKQVFHGKSTKVTILNNDDYLFNGLGSEIEVGLYHSWAVANENFPLDLCITAVAESGVIMALSHQKYDVRGVQFHPESIMTPMGRKIVENWLNQ
jgi:anthranilate synthase component 2